MGQVFLPDPRAQYNVLRVLLAAVQVQRRQCDCRQCYVKPAMQPFRWCQFLAGVVPFAQTPHRPTHTARP
jgi:hypothetical protein